jgi:hypothetical protein
MPRRSDRLVLAGLHGRFETIFSLSNRDRAGDQLAQRPPHHLLASSLKILPFVATTRGGTKIAARIAAVWANHLQPARRL